MSSMWTYPDRVTTAPGKVSCSEISRDISGASCGATNRVDCRDPTARWAPADLLPHDVGPHGLDWATPGLPERALAGRSGDPGPLRKAAQPNDPGVLARDGEPRAVGDAARVVVSAGRRGALRLASPSLTSVPDGSGESHVAARGLHLHRHRGALGRGGTESRCPVDGARGIWARCPPKPSSSLDAPVRAP